LSAHGRIPAKETTLAVLVNHRKGFRQGWNFTAWLVTMPVAVRPFPENARTPAIAEQSAVGNDDGCFRKICSGGL
jgi:hypothetical protein